MVSAEGWEEVGRSKQCSAQLSVLNKSDGAGNGTTADFQNRQAYQGTCSQICTAGQGGDIEKSNFSSFDLHQK